MEWLIQEQMEELEEKLAIDIFLGRSIAIKMRRKTQRQLNRNTG